MAEGAPTRDGGKPKVKQIPYEEPKGPKGIPGTGNKMTNLGKCGTQQKG